MRSIDLDGNPVSAVVYDMSDPNNFCWDCGMPLLCPVEFHPYEACLLFKQTHDSTVVRDALPGMFARRQKEKEAAA